MKKMNFLLFASSAVVTSIMFSQHSTTNAVNFDTSNSTNFINSIAPHAQKLGAERDLYASIMIAQAALESGYGKSDLAQNSNNLFGVKEKNGGPSFEIASNEYDENEELYSEVSAFKVFDSHLAALEYYTGHFTQTPWYTNFYKGIHRSESPSYKEALQVLQGKYATDPEYVVKLQSLIDRYNLTKYDSPSTYIPPVEENKETENEQVIVIPEKPGHYTLKTGDSLQNIAKEFKINVYDILEWNSLTSEVVHPGASLIIDKNYAPKKVASTKYDKEGNLVHTILKGESIYTLIRLYNASEKDILSWNGMSKSNFFIGQQVSVKKSPSAKTHTVQKGETLYRISTLHKTTVTNIQSLNSLKNTNIKVGQVLVVENKNNNTTQTPTPTKPSTVKPPTSQNNNSSTNKNTTTITTAKNTTHKVVKNDTLNKIAKKYSTTVKNIQSLNGLKNTTIKLGQTLVVKKTTTITTSNPKASTSSVKPSTSKPNNTASTVKKTYHKVVKGDNLNKIAKKYSTSVKNIQSLNKLKDTTIKIGQSLRVK